MKKLLLLFFCFLLTHYTYAQADCVNALLLTPGVQQCGDSAGQPGDFPGDDSAPTNPCDIDFNDDEYWFEYTAVTDGESLNITVSSLTNTWAGAFILDDCPSSSPSCVNSDVNGSSTADLTFNSGPLVSGVSYKIVIANYGAPDNTSFCLDAVVLPPPPTPSNDDCSGASMVTVNLDFACGNTTSGTIAGATASGVDESACGGTENDDVWFSFMATATSQDIELTNIAGGTADLYHSVWEGTCGGLTLVPGSCSDPNTSTVTGLTIGNTYYLRVYSWDDSPGELTTFDVCIGTEPPPPSNDDCTSATTIACDDTFTGETTEASSDNGDVTGCGMGAGVWYEFAGIDGAVTLTVTPESGFDPEIAVASSSDCISFTNVDCEDTGSGGTAESITFAATAGTTYYFYVGHYFSSTTFGNFDISVTCSTCIEPTFTLENGTNDCPTGSAFNVDVDVTDLGSATTVDITYDDGSGPQTVTGVGLGITEIGPFTADTNVDVTVADTGDATCNSVNSITTAVCPPANDDCTSATTIACDDTFTGETTEASSDNGDVTGCDMGAGVWYEFAGIDGSVTLTVTPESGFDPEIAVASSSDCISFTNVDCEDTGSGGTAETITFVATAGTTYYFYVGHYFSSTTFGNFDISVTCSTCIEPTFALENGTNNCPAGTEFNVDVDVTDLGSATTVDITYDYGLGPQTVTGVGLGITEIGPFVGGTNVDVTVADSGDATCNSTNSITTLAACPPVEDVCTGAITIPVNLGACMGITTGNNSFATDSDNDVPAPPAATCTAYAGGDIWFKLTVPASGAVTISGANSDDCCSYLWYEVYAGADCASLTSIACSDTNSGSDNNDPSTYETALTGLTPGGMIWIRAWDSNNDNGPGDFNMCAYEPECIAPTVTIPADPIDNSNCPVTVDVSISIDDLGDSSTLTINAEDDMGNPAGTGGMTSSTGIFTITNIPVPQTSWSIIIEHESNSACNVVLGPFILNCPPDNDNACNAEAITLNDAPISGNNAYSTFEPNESSGSCWDLTTENNSVWYSFVAPGHGKVEITTDFATGLDDSQAALYEAGDCSDLTTFTELNCSEDNGVTGNGWMAVMETSAVPLTGGQTYYVQVDGYGTKVGDFEIQVNELAPENDDCTSAALLAMNTTGALINQYFQAAQSSGMGPEACDMSATPTPADVWYEVDTDADGGNLIIVVEPGPNSDVVVAVYDACGSMIPDQCVDLGGNGGTETINFLANFQEKGEVSSTRDADYFVRVYEKVASGEPFEIAAQGSALPIEIGSFEAFAEKRGNQVQWSTLSEINSAYVEVQSSPNGSTRWEVIGKVQTQGESTERVDYEYFDYNPYEVTYYRLNAVDNDGKEELSGVINVRRSDVTGTLVLSPNPARELLSIQATTAQSEVATLRVIDMKGQLVITRPLSLKEGLNTMSLDINDISNGLYLLSLQTENGIQVKKFVKQ